jgi:hypothetical protein
MDPSETSALAQEHPDAQARDEQVRPEGNLKNKVEKSGKSSTTKK